MSRTDIDAATLANYLRQMCGDGSVEWCYEPMQTSVLLDMADMLDKNARLRKELASVPKCETCDAMLDCDECLRADGSHKERRRFSAENAKLIEIIADLEDMLPKSERLHIHESVNAIANDNAKLRELLRDMWNYITEPVGKRNNLKERLARLDDIGDRMRELGIEVEP